MGAAPLGAAHARDDSQEEPPQKLQLLEQLYEDSMDGIRGLHRWDEINAGWRLPKGYICLAYSSNIIYQV